MPSSLAVFSGSRGVSTTLEGSVGGGTAGHFPGETLVTDVIDLSGSACRGFIDGDTRLFVIASSVITSSAVDQLAATGSFFALDIETSPFEDVIQKTLVYEELADSTIMASFPLSQTGSVNHEALGQHERFAPAGFTYEPSTRGPDSKGTDSIAFGGLIK